VKRRIGPERVLIVDGYNVLNARKHMDGAGALADARDSLIARLQDYAGFSGQKIILVFDAWQGDRRSRSVEEHGSVQVVFTQKGETADRYIERFCDEYADKIEYRQAEVRVATSDALEQTIVLGRGATRLSSRELLLEMQQVRNSGVSRTQQTATLKRSTVADRIPADIVERMRAMVREGSKE
jgi:predicted RNA-binding protein with PIN domain